MMNDKVKKWMLPLAIVCGFSSCQKEDKPLADIPPSIRFQLNVENKDWLPTSRAVSGESKLITTSTMYESFGIWAGFITTTSRENPNELLFQRKQVMKEGDLFNSYIPWPTTQDWGLIFAYAPYAIGNSLSFTELKGQEHPTITYICPTTSDEQKDLLVASAIVESGQFHKPVALQFKHALTAVFFAEKKLPENAEITEITFSQIASTGTFNYERFINRTNTGFNNPDGTLQNVWTQQQAYKDYSIQVTYKATGTSSESPISATPLLVIPQSLNKDSSHEPQLVVKIKELPQNEPKEYRTSLNGLELVAGKKITYNLSIDDGKLEIVPEGLADWEYGGEL